MEQDRRPTEDYLNDLAQDVHRSDSPEADPSMRSSLRVNVNGEKALGFHYMVRVIDYDQKPHTKLRDKKKKECVFAILNDQL